MNPKPRGFTLIELMIAVAIVGILAAIAYPSFTESVRRSKRTDAQGALSGLAQALERYYANNGTYCGAAGGTIADCPVGAPTVYSIKVPVDGTAYYNLRITALTRNSYTIEAQRTGSMAGDKCGTMTLTATGQQGVTGGTESNPRNCWKR